MNDRTRAISILRQAREILARRLTERIVDVEEELLDDARGLTYCGEIDNVYDQLAVRLSHVNSMLSNLPAEEEQSRPALTYKAAESANAADLLMAHHEATVMPTTVTFELFARQVFCDDLEWAGRSLAVLFGVDEALGRRCAFAFHAQVGALTRDDDTAGATAARVAGRRNQRAARASGGVFRFGGHGVAQRAPDVAGAADWP